MAKNRYARDYRLVENFDERGKVKITYEYTGTAWRFLRDAQVIRMEKRMMLLRACAGWLFFLLALIPASTAMHSLYIALPFAFTAVPLMLFTDTAFVFLKAKEPLEHRHADRFNNRYPAVCLAWIVFSMAAVIGEAVNVLFRIPALKGDLVFSVCALLMLGCAVWSFSVRTRVLTAETPATM